MWLRSSCPQLCAVLCIKGDAPAYPFCPLVGWRNVRIIPALLIRWTRSLLTCTGGERPQKRVSLGSLTQPIDPVVHPSAHSHLCCPLYGPAGFSSNHPPKPRALGSLRLSPGQHLGGTAMSVSSFYLRPLPSEGVGF